MEKTITIAITGPESSGKSELAQALAAHFNAPYVKEYAREYLQDIGSNYTECDVIIMAKKQLKFEKQAKAKKASLVFFDTDAINFKIWFEFYGNKTPDFIANYIASKPYSHTLLLYPNTAWIADGLRKNEHDRIEIFQLFEQHLKANNYNYSIITKLGNERIKQAIQIIEKLIAS